MKKRDIELNQQVVLNATDEMFKVVDIGKREIIIETLKGKRRYASAGKLSNPSISITIKLPIKIVSDGTDYPVSCPQLKGFHTNGETISECLRNATYAGEGFIKSLLKHYNEEIK